MSTLSPFAGVSPGELLLMLSGWGVIALGFRL